MEKSKFQFSYKPKMDRDTATTRYVCEPTTHNSLSAVCHKRMTNILLSLVSTSGNGTHVVMLFQLRSSCLITWMLLAFWDFGCCGWWWRLPSLWLEDRATAAVTSRIAWWEENKSINPRTTSVSISYSFSKCQSKEPERIENVSSWLPVIGDDVFKCGRKQLLERFTTHIKRGDDGIPSTCQSEMSDWTTP